MKARRGAMWAVLVAAMLTPVFPVESSAVIIARPEEVPRNNDALPGDSLEIPGTRSRVVGQLIRWWALFVSPNSGSDDFRHSPNGAQEEQCNAGGSE